MFPEVSPKSSRKGRLVQGSAAGIEWKLNYEKLMGMNERDCGPQTSSE